METLGWPSPAISTGLSAEVRKLSIRSSSCIKFTRNPNRCLVFANGYSSLSPFSSQRVSTRLRKSVIVAAKKDNKKKVDSHSFVPKFDEATGPFPEAVLLKEKKVQEDGTLLPEFADVEEQELFEQLNLQLESDLNVERMRHYEVVYMIHEDHVKAVEDVNLKVQDFIKEKKGRIWRFSDWGLRRLAYKIKKAKNAHYILMNFEFEAKWINDFKGLLDKDERVIRHLVMKKDDAETEDCPPPPEFHTIRSGMDDDDNDNEDDNDEYDIDDAYDDEEDGDDLDDEDETDIDGNDSENGVIYVEDSIDESRASRNSGKPSDVTSMGRMKLRPKKVGR
ncbi:30S ribosomal protein S6 [Camellia lanceoleosa]|uniref:30S ribosomal protein S6 n=1 Tax=Camellia lanceoleosa TaxID=1840588 RepID=A0ACC0HH26_9ERIC|nr:30S ribosomal protein S6 [Camellia lanceoleosa]